MEEVRFTFEWELLLLQGQHATLGEASLDQRRFSNEGFAWNLLVHCQARRVAQEDRATWPAAEVLAILPLLAGCLCGRGDHGPQPHDRDEALP
jgi:hypothetical protein